MATQENFNNLQKKVFSENKNGDIFIGGEKIDKQLLSVLKEQADYISKSQLYEILHSTVINESANLGWESKSWDNVQFSKALKYWDTVFGNILKKLSK